MVDSGTILGYFEFWTRVLLKIESLYVNFICASRSHSKWKDFDVNHYSTFIQTVPGAPAERGNLI